jgi:hypothetical protein
MNESEREEENRERRRQSICTYKHTHKVLFARKKLNFLLLLLWLWVFHIANFLDWELNKFHLNCKQAWEREGGREIQVSMWIFSGWLTVKSSMAGKINSLKITVTFNLNIRSTGHNRKPQQLAHTANDYPRCSALANWKHFMNHGSPRSNAKLKFQQLNPNHIKRNADKIEPLECFMRANESKRSFSLCIK